MKIRPLRLTFALAIASLGATPSGQLPEYTGSGFLGSTWTENAASRIDTLDLDGDGHLDLVALESDGALTVNSDLSTHSYWLRQTGFDAFAVTHAGGERLWAVTAGAAVLVRASDMAGTTTPLATGVSSPGVVSFRGQDRPGGARVVCVDQVGGRVRVFDASSSTWSVLSTRTPTGSQTTFHDAILVDWDDRGQDWLAVVSNLGVHVYDAQGVEVVFLNGDPAQAFLDVIPGSKTAWDHDLLVYHHRTTPQDPYLLWLANSDHGEVHYTQGLAVTGIVCADFLPAARSELIVANGAQRDAFILSQRQHAGSEATPIFEFSPYDVMYVDLDQGATASITAAPAGTCADIDGDGDEELIYIDDLGRKLVLVSDTYDEDELRAAVEVDTPYPQGQDFVIDVYAQLPGSAELFSVEAWFQPDASSPPQPVEVTPSGPFAAGAHTLRVQATADPAPIFQFVFRPIDTDPSPIAFPGLVLAWSPDSSTRATLLALAQQAYAWDDIKKVEDGGGGTTRGPVTGPPVGGPD